MGAVSGRYYVRYTYRVDPDRRPQLIEALAVLRDYADWLGMVSFEVFGVEDEPWTVVELHGYDSWSHHQRLAQRQAPPEVERVYAQLDLLIDGGLDAMTREAWTQIPLPIEE
ncbi:MAG: hypothetical protein HY902_04065 [Deltaproteobacteria bacterium]|nr:hypothetical protein [Deltaproteobacteria bacterium]